MTSKFYKHDRATLEYWEIIDTGTEVIVHFGKVGTFGEAKIIPASGEPARKLTEQLCAQAVAGGFVTIGDDDLSDFVVQYPVDGFGTEDDMTNRHMIEEFLDEVLGTTGNGNCDGGDVGNGTMNIWCRVLDTKIAMSSIKKGLKSRGWLVGATLAHRRGDGEYHVDFPAGGVFRL